MQVVRPDGTQDWDLLYSPDGSAWSRTPISDLTEMTNRMVTGVLITGDRVLVSVRDLTDLVNRDAPLPDTTVLVGTLA